MKKRNRRILTVGFVAILLYVCFPAAVLRMSGSDLARLQRGDDPLFAVFSVTYKDGGSTEYRGPGYVLTDMNRITELDGTNGYVTGYVLEYPIRCVYPWVAAYLQNLDFTSFVPVDGRDQAERPPEKKEE